VPLDLDGEVAKCTITQNAAFVKQPRLSTGGPTEGPPRAVKERKPMKATYEGKPVELVGLYRKGEEDDDVLCVIRPLGWGMYLMLVHPSCVIPELSHDLYTI
jgi:hypothetical protein